MTGQPSAAPVGAPQLRAIGIVVADMAASIAFYTRLGLVFAEQNAADEPHTEALLGDIRFMLDTEASIKEIYPGWSGSGGGRIALAAELPSPADLDRCYADLAADGFGEREPWDAFWGQRYANLRDPDGNQVDLFAALPTPS